MSALCGIFGDSSIDRDVVTSMLATMNHRGPRAANVYVDGERGFALGHLHLASFAADPQTSQPPFAAANGVVAALDGGLTHGAAANGGPPGANGQAGNRDVRGVVAAWERSGDDLLSSLDGPFSLALWDKKDRTLVLSRDRLGEKTLYYHWDAARRRLVFASEIKAILAHPDVDARLDPEALSLYFLFGYLPGPKTLFTNVFKLLPGEALWCRPSRAPERRRYWHLPAIRDGVQDEAYCIRRLRELFLEGLERYVNGSKRVGVFLSGGVDSSIIVAGLRELGVPHIATFTVGFRVNGAPPPENEDLGYAREVSERFATVHHEVLIGPGHRPGEGLLRVARQFDDLVMTPNSYSKYLLADAARNAGVDSVLTGSAAAGACGVHRKFLDPRKRAHLERRTRECGSNEERYYKLRSRLFSFEEQRAFLCEPSDLQRRDVLDVLSEYMGGIESPDFFRLFLFSNLLITSTEKTLKVLDRAGTLASVELRSPYLDRRLVEFSTQLPSTFDGTSYVSLKTHLKKAFEHQLPRAVLDRTVTGYPSYYWNHGEMAGYRERLLSREALGRNGVLRYDGVQRLLEEEEHSDAKSVGKHGWALTQFCLWYEIYMNRNAEFGA